MAAAQSSTVRCVMYRWFCSVVGVTPGLAVAAGGQWLPSRTLVVGAIHVHVCT